MTSTAISLATQVFVAAIPYAVAFWACGKVVSIFLAAAFGGRVKF